MKDVNELYEGYVSFKNWNDFSEKRSDEFKYIFDQAGVIGKLKVFEIGFGPGAFLDWAKSEGHAIQGSEILPEMVSSAVARGHTAFLATDRPLIPEDFDIVIALDVLEHMDHSTLHETLESAKKMLKPTGLLIAKFPNGDSPFAGRYLYGDRTHGQPLTSGSLNQIAMISGLTVIKAFSPRPLPSSATRRLLKRLVYCFRNIIETIIGYAYFGGRFPMDPSIVVVLAPLKVLTSEII